MSQLIFRTVFTGTGITTANGFRDLIVAKGMQVGGHAYDLLSRPEFVVSQFRLNIELIVKSVFELGLINGARKDEIYQAARSVGLEKCPSEIGPQLRIQYPDQPKGEWLVVFMDSIIDSGGEPRMFHVGHNDRGRWLVADLGDSVHIWGSKNKFVFMRTR